MSNANSRPRPRGNSTPPLRPVRSNTPGAPGVFAPVPAGSLSAGGLAPKTKLRMLLKLSATATDDEIATSAVGEIQNLRKQLAEAPSERR